MKILGITLKSDLKVDEHIESLIKFSSLRILKAQISERMQFKKLQRQ